MENKMYAQQLTIAQTEYDEGLRKYMLGVYNQMTLGLLTTGIVSYFSAPILAPLMNTAWMFLFIFAPLVFSLALIFGIHKMSVATATMLFYLYATSVGLSMSTIFIIYTASSIAKVFFITAATFAAASLYGYTTKKDLTSMSTFLMMGMIGLLIATVVNIFLASSMLSWIISVVGVLIFTALTAYDSQRLKDEYLSGGEVYGLDSQEKSSIFGAFTLYLNFIVLFQYLLSLLGEKKE
jgi:FtsH-binding integral membrane protein